MLVTAVSCKGIVNSEEPVKDVENVDRGRSAERTAAEACYEEEIVVEKLRAEDSLIEAGWAERL